MLSLAVNIFDQLNQVRFERDVIVRAAQPPLRAEFPKSNSAVRTSAIVNSGSRWFIAFVKLIELKVRRWCRDFLSLAEVILGTGFTEMNLCSLPLPKLRDVERGGF